MSKAAEERRRNRAATWTLHTVDSFRAAEAETRAYWHAATPAERLNALEDLRRNVHGQDQASQRLQRFLEVVPQP